MEASAFFKPNIPRAYGSAKEVTGRALASAGGVKRLAALLGRSPSVVHAYTDPKHATHIPYDKVRTLTQEGAVAFVEDLCALAGGLFVPGTPSNAPLHDLAGRSSIEVAQFVAELLAATRDARICDRERSILLANIDDALRLLIACRVQVASAPCADLVAL